MGYVASMRLRLTEEELGFAAQMRSFFTTEIPAEIREKVAAGRHLDKDDFVTSQRILNAAGLAVPVGELDSFVYDRRDRDGRADPCD